MSSYLSKDDSKSLYGIAILLMVFHHCFSIPSRPNYDYISVWGSLWEVEMRLAWIGKLCVAIFAFISGYALSKWAQKEKSPSFIRDFKKSHGQLWRFYWKFWLVFIIFVPIGVLFYGKKCSIQLILRGLFFGEYYCAEWWYVKQYLLLMVFFPLLNTCVSWFEKMNTKGKIITGCTLFVGIAILRMRYWDSFAATVFIWFVNTFGGAYSYIFITAYLIARYNVYEVISERIRIHSFVSIVGIIVLLAVRYIYVTDPGQHNCDMILTPLLILFTGQLLHTKFVEQWIAPVLRLLGKYSTFMWLTHTFYIYTYFQWIGLLPKYSILIYLWVLLLALVNAIILSWIYVLIEKRICSIRHYLTEARNKI